jgi:hypothetical protein
VSEQIIQQPNGRFAVWSTVTDSLIVLDATREELISWRAEQAAEKARVATENELARVLDPCNPRPYFQFTLTWEEAVERNQGEIEP